MKLFPVSFVTYLIVYMLIEYGLIQFMNRYMHINSYHACKLEKICDIILLKCKQPLMNAVILLRGDRYVWNEKTSAHVRCNRYSACNTAEFSADIAGRRFR